MAFFSGRDSEAAFRSPMCALFGKTLAIASVFVLLVWGFDSGYLLAVLLAWILCAAGQRYAWSAIAIVLGLFLVRRGLPWALPLHPLTVPLTILSIIALGFAYTGSLVDERPLTPWGRTAGKRTGTKAFLLAVGLAALLICVSREVPLGPSVGFGIISLAIARAHPRSPRPGLRSRIAIGLSLCIALALFLVVSELGARLSLPEYPGPTRILVPHPQYGFTNAIGKSALLRTRVSPTEWRYLRVRTSEQGLRGSKVPPKQDNEFRILMVGDSFTFAAGVNEADTIPSILESLLADKLEGVTPLVINGGIGAAAPYHEFGMFLERGLPLEPDAVILQLFPANDIDGCLAMLNKRLRAYTVQQWEFLGYKRLRIEGDKAVRLNDALTTHSRLYRELELRTVQGMLLPRIVRSLRWVTPYDFMQLPPSEDRWHILEVDIRNPYPELEEGFALLQEWVLRFRDECRRRGIQFGVYCIPIYQALEEERWIAVTSAVQPHIDYERGGAIAKMEAFFEKQDIPYFSVDQALMNFGSVEETYFIHDGHLNEVGNRVVAGEARSFVLNHFDTPDP